MSQKRKKLPNMQRRPSRKQQASVDAQAESSGETITYYIHGPHGIHAQQTDGEWEWMLQDGLNSVRSVVDSDLAVQQSVNYDPYGNPFGLSGSEQTIYGYTGEPVDASGLVYLRNRYYNPNMGTFISPDPYEGTPSNPLSLNRYAYVQGNPVNRIDPSGMISVQAMTSLMHSNPLAFAKTMNAGLCSFQQQDCNYPPYTNCLSTPEATAAATPVATAQATADATATPMSTPEATASPDTNPCSAGALYPVFGTCGEQCAPHFAGQGYNPPHRAIDIAPSGAFDQQYLPPNWATDAGTKQFATVYAVADGTILTYGTSDALVLRVNNTWEFVYIHISPLVASGTFVKAGTPIGTVISHTYASTYTPEGHPSDEDHLHFGLRHPDDITESVDPASCLGLTGG